MLRKSFNILDKYFDIVQDPQCQDIMGKFENVLLTKIFQILSSCYGCAFQHIFLVIGWYSENGNFHILEQQFSEVILENLSDATYFLTNFKYQKSNIFLKPQKLFYVRILEME